jgi:1,2-diacylglycerol 3-beta-galactosyltransferase
MKKKIAILYADTGGGHRSSAEAIAQGIQLAFPGQFEVKLANNFKELPFPFSIAEEIYPPIIAFARPLYEATFKLTNNKDVVRAIKKAAEPLTERIAAEFVHSLGADLYISVHPFYNHMLPEVLREQRNPAPLVTVVTDMVTGHIQWYSMDVDRCIVPTEFAQAQALEYGLPPGKIFIGGQPVWPDFAARMGNRAATRAQFGLTDDSPVVLMMGGGDGMGRMGIFANALATSPLKMQLLVVCGRNEKLRDRVMDIKPVGPTLTTLGFTKQVPELMGAADVLLTKAGPGTISEGFIAGLPIIIYDAIPGQEEGNIDYVVDHGAGRFCATPWGAVRTLKRWFEHKSIYQAVQRASQALADPGSAVRIARLAVETLNLPVN